MDWLSTIIQQLMEQLYQYKNSEHGLMDIIKLIPVIFVCSVVGFVIIRCVILVTSDIIRGIYEYLDKKYDKNRD